MHWISTEYLLDIIQCTGFNPVSKPRPCKNMNLKFESRLIRSSNKVGANLICPNAGHSWVRTSDSEDTSVLSSTVLRQYRKLNMRIGQRLSSLTVLIRPFLRFIAQRSDSIKNFKRINSKIQELKVSPKVESDLTLQAVLIQKLSFGCFFI